MRTLTQGDFLALWETGHSLHPLDRGLLAAQAAFPELQESVADWPMGRRNRALAEVHCAVFGSTLHGWTKCLVCAEQLEFQMDVKALARSHAPGCDERIVVGDLSYRLPTSRDLAAVAGEKDAVTAARILMQRCCLAENPPTLGWDEEEIDAVGARMAAADPLAEILLKFDCPGCGASFEETLDLTSFLWAEMEGRAKQLLIGVHALASAYGWSEAEILSLSAARREVYLEMVRA
jgi:hypothetical protein